MPKISVPERTLVCWKCGRGMPLYKVKNSWVFACKKHKDLDVPKDASSDGKNHNLLFKEL